MTNWKISPSTLAGAIVIPPSKSQSIRALLFGLMGKGKTAIHNLLDSPDVAAMIHACRHLGGIIEKAGQTLEITGVNGRILESEDVIDCKNSGLVLRLVGALGGLSSKPIVLTGDDSVRNNREVTPLLEALIQLGATAFSLRSKGGAPILVKGPFCAQSATLSGEDSQPVSGILTAASFAPFSTEIFVVNPGEKPWVNLTLTWLKRLGIGVKASPNFDYYQLEGSASYEGFSYQVPGDFSSSAFPIAAAVLTNSEISLHNLDMLDPQGDQKLISILQKMGAKIEIDQSKKMVHVKKNSRLQGMVIDVNECIDATLILAVIGCFAEGETCITGAKIARKKECDRLACITEELKKMGADIEENEDGLIVRPSTLKGTEVMSHQDHRMAMALAVAGLKAKGETKICHTACVAKSYPDFAYHFQQLGASLHTVK